MSDEPDEDRQAEEQPDLGVRRRQQAQGAAGDLARMGIDPRSLGLGEPDRVPVDRADEPAQAPVVPLRAGLEVPAPVVTPVVTPAPAAPSRPVPAEEPTARSLPARPARIEPARLLRALGRGLATPDAAAAMQGERALVDAVRRRQTDRRVVAFVAGKGGVGCTTLAVAVGTTLTALRDDRTIVVDVQQGTPSLGELLGAPQPRTVAGLLAEREATDPPRASSGLDVLDGADWDQGLARGDVVRLLERLGSEHAFHLLDVGDDAGEGGHAALARADQVVLVSGPGRTGAVAAGSALDRIRYVNPAAATRVVEVVVCPHEAALRDTQRLLSGGAGAPVVVPPDVHLQTGAPFEAGAVSAASREAFLRVAAAVADGTAT